MMQADMPFFVYVLECSDGTLYTGWTNDVAARLSQHQAGRGARYTRSRRPLRLVYSEEAPSSAQARRREAAIKRLNRQSKLRLIDRTRQATADASP